MLNRLPTKLDNLTPLIPVSEYSKATEDEGYMSNEDPGYFKFEDKLFSRNIFVACKAIGRSCSFLRANKVTSVLDLCKLDDVHVFLMTKRERSHLEDNIRVPAR